MIWTVVWNPDVENELASLWLKASDRLVVRDAADAIDAILRRDPYFNSEARDGDTRVLNALLRRYPNLRLAVQPTALRWRGGLLLRGLEALPVKL